MSDESYNTNLLGIKQAAGRHKAQCYTAHATLTELVNMSEDLAYSSLAHTITLIKQDIPTEGLTQTSKWNKGILASKLINIWTLQQDLLSGRDFVDPIIVHYNIKGKTIVLDVHPGRTRLLFHNVYTKKVPVLIIDYSGLLDLDPPFDVELLTDEKCETGNTWQYRITNNWDLPSDPAQEYLLVQPNDNDRWHWHMLDEPVTFQPHYKYGKLMQVTANGKPFLECVKWRWRIVI